jgi:hypothetical protein
VIVPLVAAALLVIKILIIGSAAHWASSDQTINGLVSHSFGFGEYVGTLLIMGVFVGLGWVIFATARPSWDVRPAAASINTDPDAVTGQKSVSSAIAGNSRHNRWYLHQVKRWQKWLSQKGGLPSLAPVTGIALVCFGAWIFSFMTAQHIPKTLSWNSWNVNFFEFPLTGGVGALVVFTVALYLKRFLGKLPKSPLTVPSAGPYRTFLLAIAALMGGVAGGLVLGAGEEFAAALAKYPNSTALILALGPLWVVTSYNVGDAVFLGLTVRRPGNGKIEWSDPWGDEEREWVARTGGCLTVFTLVYAILCLLTFFGPLFDRRIPWVVGLAALALSALSSIGLGSSPLSDYLTKIKGLGLLVRRFLSISTSVFAGLLVIYLSLVLDLFLFKKPLLELLRDHEGHLFADLRDPLGAGIVWLGALAFALACISAVAARFVNINRFSLYDLYRMRLTREFLGASNKRRRPDFWTGFDTTDDIPTAELWPPKSDDHNRLYPVINATLSMVATKRLEWQERKAVSFVFTPRYSGSGATSELGFRSTAEYAGGIMLGWAMSVSGAAFSPNAGRATMPGPALLMTLFNVRLGVWSGNPGRAGGSPKNSYRERGPRNALRLLFDEAFTRTNDTREYVYLSDGGHFDNLGLYEMLRRRCRFIVVSDATRDPDYAYADLGNVVRKAAIDFGIRITFKYLDTSKRGETAVKGAYSAFATIDYPEHRKSNRRRQRGYLLYLKAYCGGSEEPADVRAYALANPAFPHDTTLNQFFGESQFESYRALGSYTVMELGRKAGFKSISTATRPGSLRKFFRGVRRNLPRAPSAHNK